MISDTTRRLGVKRGNPTLWRYVCFACLLCFAAVISFGAEIWEVQEFGMWIRPPAKKDKETHLAQVQTNVCGEDVNKSQLGEVLDCSGVPWPDRHKLCPWPAVFEEMHIINFTVASARDLLRGRTVFINGDSTSRRLMWSLCNFLADDRNSSEPHKRSGEGCCGTQRVDIHCNLPSVLADDIMIEYNPPLFWEDSIAWLDTGLNKAYNLRNQSGLTGMFDNTITADEMPRRKQAKSVHVFHPFAATWHQCLGRNETDEHTCGLNRGVGTDVHDVQETADRLISSFCPRFERAVAATIQNNKPPLHMHGLTNILAYRGGVKHSDRFNSWMLTLAQVASSEKRKLSDITSCGFLDQTTWMSTNATLKDVRLDCMPSDKWQNIHIYNEYGQLMRVQLLLNAILKTEKEWIEVGNVVEGSHLGL